jgi:RNA polymerase sigma-70 factor (ECF subfamily)
MTTKKQAAEQQNSASEGLTSAFAAIRPALLRLVARIVGPDCIEDVVQETYIRSFEASRLQTIRHPRSFMYRAAKNIALNHIGKADNKLTTNVADFSELDVYKDNGAIEFEYEFDTRERFSVFCQAVEKLPLQCRRAFILKRVYGLSQREIAERLGISQSTVEKQVAKGLFMCATFMDEMGYPVEGRGSSAISSRRAARGK